MMALKNILSQNTLSDLSNICEIADGPVRLNKMKLETKYIQSEKDIDEPNFADFEVSLLKTAQVRLANKKYALPELKSL